MANERFANVWDALEQDPVERERLKMLSRLMMFLTNHIEAQGWTQVQAAEHLGVTQPRISDLMRGKINVFSVDSVLAMLSKAGLQLEVRLKDAA